MASMEKSVGSDSNSLSQGFGGADARFPMACSCLTSPLTLRQTPADQHQSPNISESCSLLHANPHSALLCFLLGRTAQQDTKHFFFCPLQSGGEGCLINQALVEWMIEKFERHAHATSNHWVHFQHGHTCSLCSVCIGKGPAKQKINACFVFVFTYLHATIHSIHVSKEEEEADGKLEGQDGWKDIWGNKMGGPGKGVLVGGFFRNTHGSPKH